MPDFTRPDGSLITIPAADIARARASLSHEIPGAIGTALFKPKQLVLETIDIAGAALKAELATFTLLHAPNSASIWFDAAKSGDAEPPRQHEQSPNTNSVVLMGGVRQRLSETVAQAQLVIDAARAAS